jgi:hypothetical protein
MGDKGGMHGGSVLFVLLHNVYPPGKLVFKWILGHLVAAMGGKEGVRGGWVLLPNAPDAAHLLCWYAPGIGHLVAAMGSKEGVHVGQVLFSTYR